MRNSTIFIVGFVLLTGCATQPESAVEKPNLSAVLQQEVATNGVESAMLELAREMERDQDVSAFCHALAHKIGHAAHDKMGIDALQESSDLCGSGYFHGVIERHFQHSSEVLETFKTLCTATDGRCFHGLGHGLMFATENDVPTALSHCDELDTRAQKIQCAEGVFMENFNTNEGFHQTLYKNPENPFYPCNEQERPYKGVCTFYAVRYYLELHPHDHTGVVEWCSTVDEDVQDACYKGVGSALTKYHMADHTIAQQACDQLDQANRLACYQGIVSYTIVHFASPDKGQEWCDSLDGALQKDCERIVRESRLFYASTTSSASAQ